MTTCINVDEFLHLIKSGQYSLHCIASDIHIVLTPQEFFQPSSGSSIPCMTIQTDSQPSATWLIPSTPNSSLSNNTMPEPKSWMTSGTHQSHYCTEAYSPTNTTSPFNWSVASSAGDSGIYSPIGCETPIYVNLLQPSRHKPLHRTQAYSPTSGNRSDYTCLYNTGKVLKFAAQTLEYLVRKNRLTIPCSIPLRNLHACENANQAISKK